MRYQFFLDARDYVKYALLEDLMNQLRLRQLTLIWMLTPDVGNTHGSIQPRFDKERRALNEFFNQTPRPQLTDVQTYYESQGFRCLSYGDTPEFYITKEARTDYFSGIQDSHLQDALVFLDPDNGVEPRSGASILHVRLEELSDLWSRMNDESILVVYQHKPRVPSDVFWPDVTDRVAAALDAQVNALTFKAVGFLIISRNHLRGLPTTEGHLLVTSNGVRRNALDL